MDPSMTTNALAQLRDIHLPDPVAFWPLAPGWWAVVFALLATAVLIAFIERRRQRSARRAALGEVARLEAGYSATRDTCALASGLSALLRRISLLAGERVQVASLHGAARARALESSAAGFSPSLLAGIEAAVYRSPNREVPGEDVHAWLDAVRDFIRRAS